MGITAQSECSEEAEEETKRRKTTKYLEKTSTDTNLSSPRKFWKTHLVRLKYHNPAVPMTITRTDDGQAPAQMTVHFSSSPSSSASISTASETASRSEVIDMKSQSESSIMEQLIALTKARAVKVSPEDARQTQELEEYTARNAKVRELMAAAMARRKKERDILNQARGEAEALTRDE
jgi:large subunit ribosomal protein MRP49